MAISACSASEDGTSTENPVTTTNTGNQPAPEGECPSYRGLKTEVEVQVLVDKAADEAGSVDYLRLDATHAYWINAFNTYYRVPLAGGAVEEVLKLEAENTLWTDTVLYQDSLFFRNGEDLMKVPKAGGEAEKWAAIPEVSASTLRTLAVDGSTLYMLSMNAAGCSPESELIAVSLEDGTKTVLADTLSCPDDLAVDADSVYVSVAGPLDATDYEHHEPALVRIPKAGGTPVVLQTGTRVTRLRVDGGAYVFGLVGGQEHDGTALVKIPKAGGAVATLVPEACGFDSDLLEIVDGSLLFSNSGDLVLMTTEGQVITTLEHATYQFSTSHESIAVSGKRLVVSYGGGLMAVDVP
jgi:hypothetical protein